ncbi:MlaD family protein [uncultured Bacteroides sp.]|uniref:MlaD family protein n=1 Tax=uncultured Bacteroides sp. TaxID=162156 RepID=UPI002AAAC9CD|nr:MlaD family protein [uncultured Bacteroides sp.]
MITKYFNKEVKIGLVTILALSVIIYGVNYLKGINMFKPSSYLYVKYTDVNGLTKSSPVFADGYRIGIVRTIAYDYAHPKNVTVEVELDEKMRIPKGSTAELVSEMMGGIRMNILLANNPRESYSNGDTIPGIVNYGIIGSASTLIPQMQKMLPKLDSILSSLNGILNSPDIPNTLHSIKNTTANLEVTSRQLKHLMINDIPQLAGKLNTISNNFVEVSNNLKGINYAATFNKIDSTMTNIKLITERLNSKDNSIGLLLNDPQLYYNLNTASTNAAKLLEDLKTNPKRYVHFSIFGKK